MNKIATGAALLLFAAAWTAQAEQIGEVSTVFKLLGANHKIVVEAFDDPDIPGATCYVSRAKTGGIKGSLGLAEDTSDASIACRQTGPITCQRMWPAANAMASGSSASPLRCCSKSCKWCVFMTRNARLLSI